MQAIQGFIGTGQVSILDHLLHEVAVLFEALALTDVLTELSLTVFVVEKSVDFLIGIESDPPFGVQNSLV